METLNLDQIQGLSDKALISLFSDLSANEMSRNYTYTCFLMPGKCHEEFTSFGNEQKARIQMRSHLLGHIERLIDDANGLYVIELFAHTTFFKEDICIKFYALLHLSRPYRCLQLNISKHE